MARRLAVLDGSRWWRYAPSVGAQSNVDDERVGNGTGRELRALLDPWSLVGALSLEVFDRSERAGRSMRVSSSPTPTSSMASARRCPSPTATATGPML